MNTSVAWLRTLLIVFSAVIGIAVIGVAALVAQACLHPWRFPAPTGQYKVGVHDSALVDSSRIDPIIKGKTKRELLVRFYYPANPVAGAYVKALPTLDSSLAIWADDTRFVISALDRMRAGAQAGSVEAFMDLSRMGIFGHSMGGMTAQKCIVQEPRLAAGLSFDPAPIRENLTDSIIKPFLFLQTEFGSIASVSAFNRCRNDAYYGVIKGVEHFDFSDIGLWCARKPFWRLMKFTGSLDGYRCQEMLSAVTVAFFDRYLKNEPIDIIASVKPYPEMLLRVKTDR